MHCSKRCVGEQGTRATHYEHGLQTKVSEVRLKIPKLRRQTFETAIIERCWLRFGVNVEFANIKPD